uniref:Glucose-methanol-choline oxidoreductase N-terminal domain-containing protein n=1 Tax=Glossina brevipalpis TaxID=37001 RepID=A0A1A9W473_9MUSC
MAICLLPANTTMAPTICSAKKETRRTLKNDIRRQKRNNSSNAAPSSVFNYITKGSLKSREALALRISSNSSFQSYPSSVHSTTNNRLMKIYPTTQQISDKAVTSTTHSDEGDRDNDLNERLTDEYSSSSISSTLSSIKTASSTSTFSLYSFGRRNSNTSQSQTSSCDNCNTYEYSDVQEEGFHVINNNNNIRHHIPNLDDNDANNAYSDDGGDDDDINEDDYDYSNSNEQEIHFMNDINIVRNDDKDGTSLNSETFERINNSKENQKFGRQIRKPFRLYENTKPLSEIRSTEGLLSIAIKTIKLVKRNQLLQQRLNQLQIETSEFIQSVLNNPENRHFREKIQQKMFQIRLKMIVTLLAQNLIVAENLMNLASVLFNNHFVDSSTYQREYDFIVVGAGSAGCVVANRLSEIKSNNVLLLEAGNFETLITEVPLLAPIALKTTYNWAYKSEPSPYSCLGLKDGVCNWHKGCGVGGSSLINFMLYTRGHYQDFDLWSKLGNKGWSYNEVLPYFKKSERFEIEELKNSHYHGYTGPLNVNYAAYKSRMLNVFFKSGLEMGYNIIDPNAKQLMGFCQAQATLRNGTRCSTGKAFLQPIKNRSNFQLSVRSRVTKIILRNNLKNNDLIASAVEFVKDNRRIRIKARKEIILSAGSVASPQLLLLSGIGPRENLREFGISVLKELQVGYNLQDHVFLPGLVFTTNETTVNQRLLLNPQHIWQYLRNGTGPYSSPSGADGLAFNAFDMVPVLLRPNSRGRISLKSRNPFAWPKMEGNLLQHPNDIQILVEGIEMILQLAKTSAMLRVDTKFNQRPFWRCEHLNFASQEYWHCCLRLYANSLQHQVGTCKMGPFNDSGAVVDSQLKVYGVENLRVVDASIMPTIPAGHPNAVVIMIAEKASDMIKERWR